MTIPRKRNINDFGGQTGCQAQIFVTGDRELTELDGGALLIVTSAAVITLPAGVGTPGAGFFCSVFRDTADAVSFAASGGAQILSSAGVTPSITDQNQAASVSRLPGDRWAVIGALTA